jgi:DNA-directed RNA polymerase subunit RPC12/RpoP
MFSQHPKSKFWSERNILKPTEVSLNSHKKIWFDCGECGHEFNKILKDVNILNTWCPYCANKKLCDNSNNCKLCFDKCFASVDYSKNWSNRNIEAPYEYLKKSHKSLLMFKRSSSSENKLELRH